MTRRLRALTLVLGVVLVGTIVGLSRIEGRQAADDPVARVGDRTFSLEEVDARALMLDAGNFQGMRLQQALYEARRAVLDELIAEHLFATEAERRGVKVEDMLTSEVTGKVQPVSDADVAAWHKANPQQVQGRPLEQLQEPIRQLLSQQRNRGARQAFIDTLKGNVKVEILLDPPRTEVAAGTNDPVLGPPTAPVEIVEFSDFQCPFCSRVGPTLKQIQQTYGERVRLVFRDLPLPNHAQAFKAAEAAQCAHDQGKFWEYHDVLFANQSALAPEQLKGHAATLGLDTAVFAACLDEGRHAERVRQDMAEAERLGINGTPAFFINGRFLSGALPFESFRAVIDDELARNAPSAAQ